MDNVQRHKNCAKHKQTIANSPCPHINAKLLLTSRMEILLCPLVLVLSTANAATPPASLNGCSGPR